MSQFKSIYYKTQNEAQTQINLIFYLNQSLPTQLAYTLISLHMNWYKKGRYTFQIYGKTLGTKQL